MEPPAGVVSFPFGSSAVVGSFVASADVQSGVAEESEDPWLCGPGFRRVCLCRGMAKAEIGSCTGPVKGKAAARRLCSSSARITFAEIAPTYLRPVLVLLLILYHTRLSAVGIGLPLRNDAFEIPPPSRVRSQMRARPAEPTPMRTRPRVISMSAIQ